ncbi:transmembrane protein 69-like [Corythoichthys intestinalis]|uniref:transmembrane protein 69-like n=1 Tax=Corythoichthys intestinalis TaxID=161448 RepID=UPI0025A68157|nr:transmembrane protein 69-like [Corythoichthys intestinalis]
MLSVLFRKRCITTPKLYHPPKCWTSSLIRLSDGGSSDNQQVSWTSFARPTTEWREVSRGKYSPKILAFIKTGLSLRCPCYAVGFTARNQSFHSSVVRLKKRPQPVPPPRELDLLRYDMNDFWKSPKPALWLGVAGLIPFVAPPLIMGVTESYFPELAYAQVAYGASIVSFLGGARWGFALPESSPAKPDWINLSNSVVPSLLAWVTMLMADNIVPSATMVIMALGISLHYDLSLLPTYPSWFKALRAFLTFVAFFSLLGTLITHQMYPEKTFFSA